MGETGGVGSTFYFYIPMINKSLQSIVTTISINLSTNLLVQMRAIYVHFQWESVNEWNCTFIYLNWEIYEPATIRQQLKTVSALYLLTRWDEPATIRQQLKTVSALYLLTRWVEEWGGCFNNVSKGEGVIRRRQEPIFCFIRIILLYSSPTKTIRVSLLEYFTVNDASATIWQLHRAQTVDSIVLELRMQLNHCHCRWFSSRLFVSIQLIITMGITLSHNSEGGESWR